MKGWSTPFLFAFGSERTLVTCQSCEARSASQRFTREQCPFISQCKPTEKCTTNFIFMLKRWKPITGERIILVFPSRDQCLSLENICHSFLMLHCRRMPWDCKYCIMTIFKITLVWIGIKIFILNIEMHIRLQNSCGTDWKLYFWYRCIHLHRFENDRVERILSC